MKIAVLISGRGSNLQSLIDACSDDDFPAEISLVISNKADALGLKRASEASIPTKAFNHKDFSTREEFDVAMSDAIEASGAEFICLAGFMRLLSDDFVKSWRDKLINIHPSLLPSFKGLHVHEQVIERGVRFSGCTVHFVRSAMDEGPILAQAVVPVLPDDTPDTLGARVLEQEHIIYPLALRLIAEGKVRVSGEQVIIDGHKTPNISLTNPEK
ncbi:MAG: phosphoribosylglycinamide formyltransferase [Rhodospirillaceae bacterium]|nr:phosphoribosylglycinamide formyltransferase [Rhodospirillaceae bacterium]